MEFSLENPVGEETAFNIRTARNLLNGNEINNTLISIYSIAPGQTMSLPLEIIPDQLQKKKNNNNNNNNAQFWKMRLEGFPHFFY
jgi:hypothetical protein